MSDRQPAPSHRAARSAAAQTTAVTLLALSLAGPACRSPKPLPAGAGESDRGASLTPEGGSGTASVAPSPVEPLAAPPVPSTTGTEPASKPAAAHPNPAIRDLLDKLHRPAAPPEARAGAPLGPAGATPHAPASPGVQTVGGVAPRPHAPEATAVHREPSPPTPPRAASAEPRLSPSELVERSGKFARSFAEAIASGEVEKARAHLLSAREFEEVLTAGIYSVVGGTVVPNNEKFVARLVESFGGKSTESSWEPGEIRATQTGSSIFRRSVPRMSEAILTLRVEGTAVPVKIDQLLWVHGRWKIFKLHY